MVVELDRPHLKEHLYAGVEAMEFPEKLKHFIVDALVSLIEVGKVHKVIKKFQFKYQVNPNKNSLVLDQTRRFSLAAPQSLAQLAIAALNHQLFLTAPPTNDS